MRSNHGTPQNYPPSEKIHPLVGGLLQQLSTALAAGTARGTEAVPARGTKLRVTISRRRLNWLRVSALVGMSSQSEEIMATSLMPMKYQTYANVLNIAKTI